MLVALLVVEPVTPADWPYPVVALLVVEPHVEPAPLAVLVALLGVEPVKPADQPFPVVAFAEPHAEPAPLADHQRLVEW